MPDKDNKYGHGRHDRRSIRLKDYDYSQHGAYFVTICTKNGKCLFGEIVASTMRLNQSGELIQRIWHELPNRYTNLDLDAFILMPNHLHGVVVLTDNDAVGAYRSDIQIRICYPAEPNIISNGRPSVAAQLLRTYHPK
jgi:putative transposase